MRRGAALAWATALATTGALIVGAVLLATPAPSRAGVESDFPQAKINYVDISSAPRIRMFVSLLDRRLRAVPAEWVEELSVQLKVKGEKARPLFTMKDGEPSFPEPDEDTDIGIPTEADLPLVQLAEEDEAGIAAVVVVPGIDPDYRDTELGERVKNGAGLFFKKLGKANRMNIIWYSDELLTYVQDKGRKAELTLLSATMREKCADWQLQQLETYGEEPEPPEEGAGPNPDEAYCGLTAEYGELPNILLTTAFQGAYPKLFGLEPTYCGKPEVDRINMGKFTGGDDDDDDDETGANDRSAMDLALEMLIREAVPGQPKVLILLGDGRDDYVHRLKECKERFRRTKPCSKKQGKARTKCVDAQVKKAIAEEQLQFIDKATLWIALAKAAGIRIYSVVHPNARPHERERLELLAWRTGGTARAAQNENEVVDLYTELADELNGQHLISFTDFGALPGTERSYEAKLKGSGRTFKTPAFQVSIPHLPEGLPVVMADFRSMGEGKVGKTGFLLIGIGVALILALILFKIFGKIFKKILGKGAKGVKGAGKGAKGLTKGAKGGMKGAKKLAKGAKKLGKLK